MKKAKFKMIDEDFVCLNCQREVKASGYTARDHCPHCLYSVHLDNNPGDREANCGGLLKAIDIEKSKKDTWKIIYQCQSCGTIKKNQSLKDDNFDKLLELMSKKD